MIKIWAVLDVCIDIGLWNCQAKIDESIQIFPHLAGEMVTIGEEH